MGALRSRPNACLKRIFKLHFPEDLGSVPCSRAKSSAVWLEVAIPGAVYKGPCG